MVGTGAMIVVGRKLTSAAARKFGKRVIERWTRYRAAKFCEGFVAALSQEVKTGAESAEVDAALDAILSDELKSEILYDAYRKVCFAKSKTLGPRIIGILTGYLVVQGRIANDVEDQVFAAAENLSDGELVGLFNTFREWGRRADTTKDPKTGPHWVGDSLVIPWSEETRDSAWPSSMEEEIEVSALNFGDAFDDGNWPLRAERLGLLSSRITQRQVTYQEDSERHIDQDGVLTVYSTTLSFEPPCRKLCDLIERSLGALPEEPSKGKEKT